MVRQGAVVELGINVGLQPEMVERESLREIRLGRIKKVNELMRVIGRNGRRFFHNEENGFAFMWQDGRGRLWWRDEYTQDDIYLHYRYWKKGFSNGGTLRQLVIHLKEFVMTGQPIPNVLGPWPNWYCEGDPWGYGRSMDKVRETAVRLGIVSAVLDVAKEDATLG